MRKLLVIPAFIAVMLGAISCGTSSRMISSWTPAGMMGVNLNKVIVISIMGGQFQAHQTTVEQAVVRQLREQGVEAMASTEIFRPAEFRNMSEEQILAQLSSSGFEQVMLVSLLDRTRDINFVPGRIRTQPVFMPVHHHPMMRRYAFVHARIYEPGYYTSTTQYFLEAQVFTIKDGDLIYIGQANMRNPRDVNHLITSFSGTILTDMRARGLIR